MAKKFMYLNTKAPYGTIYALESLEVVLIGRESQCALMGDDTVNHHSLEYTVELLHPIVTAVTHGVDEALAVQLTLDDVLARTLA